MNADEYRRGKYVWVEDDIEPTDTADPAPVTAHLKGLHNQQDHAGDGAPVEVDAKYDPHQLRATDGRWTDGNIDMPDMGDDVSDEEPGEFDDINSQLPDSYLNTYGKVVSSSNITGEFEPTEDDPYAVKDSTRVDATVTEKGGFHVAQGVKDRKVVQQLDPVTARVISDMMWDIDEGKQELPVTDEHTRVSVAQIPGGGYRVTWASGATTDMDADRLTDISEALDGVASSYREEFGGRAPVKAARRHKDGDPEVTAAAGADVTPGHDELHHYWTKDPEGLAKWATSTHPWTELVQHLTKHVGRRKAEVFASKWYMEVFGFASGSDKARVAHGKPPRGKVIGPG